MAQTLSPAELAVELESDARTVRKFLRSITPKENQPGKGSRWSIEKRQLRTLRKQYTEWDAARQQPAPDETDEVETPVED